MSTQLPQNYKVLITDDSDDDRFFLKRVLARFPRFKIVGEACDGQEAISYLAGDGKFSNRQEHPFPDLLLLDLKMPRTNGFDVLQWLQTRSFPRLTVIVLSNSELAEDVGASLALGAKGFWAKTADPKRQDITAREIETLLDERWRKWSVNTPSESPKIHSRAQPKQGSAKRFSQPRSFTENQTERR